MSNLEQASEVARNQALRTLRILSIAAWVIAALCVVAGILMTAVYGNLAALTVGGAFLPVAFIVTAISEHAKSTLGRRAT